MILHTTSDADINDLGYFGGLEKVSLGGGGFDTRSLIALRGLPNLKEMTLPNKYLSREDLNRLAALLPKCSISGHK